MKRCSKCKLNRNDFNKRKASDDGLSHWCKQCVSDYMKTRTRTSEYRRRETLKRCYGMTVNDYDSLLGSQNGKCAVCGTNGGKLQVDHDHSCCRGVRSCGQCVRGLLCGRCNKAIGLAMENVEILASMILYISMGKSGAAPQAGVSLSPTESITQAGEAK